MNRIEGRNDRPQESPSSSIEDRDRVVKTEGDEARKGEGKIRLKRI